MVIPKIFQVSKVLGFFFCMMICSKILPIAISIPSLELISLVRLTKLLELTKEMKKNEVK